MRFVLISSLILMIAGCASELNHRKMSSTESSEQTLTCQTPGIMDSGYTVSVLPGAGNSLHGTIATVSTWGTDKPLYDGDFTLEVVRSTQASTNKGCHAQLKGRSAGVKSGTAQIPVIVAEADGQKSAMFLHEGGTAEELSCKVSKALAENLQKCQAQNKQ